MGSSPSKSPESDISCETHLGTRVSHYHEGLTKLLCSKCLLRYKDTSTSSHSALKISEFTKSSQYHGLKHRVTKYLAETSKNLKTTKDKLDNYEHSLQIDSRKICHTLDDFMEEVQLMVKGLKDEVEEAGKPLSTQIEELGESIAVLEEHQQVLQKQASDTNMLSSVLKAKRITEEAESHLEKDPLHLSLQLEFNSKGALMFEDVFNFKRSTSKNPLGSICVNIIPTPKDRFSKTPPFSGQLSQGKRIVSTARESHIELETEKTLEYLWKMSKNSVTSVDVDNANFTGSCVLANGQFVLANGENNSLLVTKLQRYPNEFRANIAKTIPLSGLPHDLACDPADDTVAVTLPNKGCIEFFYVEQNKILPKKRVLVKKLFDKYTEPKFKQCSSVGIVQGGDNSRDGQIIFSNEKGQGILKVSTGWMHLDFKYINNPLCIAADAEKMQIIVVCWFNNMSSLVEWDCHSNMHMGTFYSDDPLTSAVYGDHSSIYTCSGSSVYRYTRGHYQERPKCILKSEERNFQHIQYHRDLCVLILTEPKSCDLTIVELDEAGL